MEKTLNWYQRAAGKLYMRILGAVLMPAGVAAGALILYKFGNPIPCMFYKFTHLHCPGCGTGRALTALTHFHFLEALGYNALLFVFLPFLVYYAVKFYISFVFFKGQLKTFGQMSITANISIMTGLFIYWVLRNLPWSPFNLLAP